MPEQDPLPPQNAGKKSKKSKKKGAMNPALLTPEYIAQQRALKLEEKNKKRDLLAKLGIDPVSTIEKPYLKFIKRKMLQVAVPSDERLDISIMTYNMLAQALIRRKLFPTSGDALKWGNRSVVLLNELKYYNCDIMCLQEVDYIQFNSFWNDELGKLGYDSQFYREGTKNHGVVVFWRKALFNCIKVSHINHDQEKTSDIPPRTVAQNVGVLVALEFSEKIKQKFPFSNRKGILIGTTHLFWHPFGTYERTRQTYLILKKMKEFHMSLTGSEKEDKMNDEWFTLFAGDLNSQPFDAPYLSMTSKPVLYSGRAKMVLECSTSFQYSKKRNGESTEDEDGGNIEKFGPEQPQTPVPDQFSPTDEQKELVKKIQVLHNSLPVIATSLYSAAYAKIHPENAGKDNDRNEPLISNWAHAWRGLLDYILVIQDWGFGDRTAPIDNVQLFQQTGIAINSLLRMPLPAELGDEGFPKAGMYGSDHLCMAANVGLAM
ncbi:hypothetical protein LJB42_004884 [Komagataella kurtzmanii]|nr:hypothetical protein LJB42_004884 [Komagataella kurtzmanii]